MTKITGDEYMQILVERQQKAIVDTDWPTMERDGYEVQEWAKKMAFPLEKMIRPEDKDIFTPPDPQRAPKKERKPRYYRPASYWRERLERDRPALERLTAIPDFDPAMVNLPLKGRAITDSQLDRYRELSKRISHAEYMLRQAERREA